MQYRISDLTKLFIAIILITSCSPKISKLTTANRYIKGFNIQLYNDSLALHFTSPADITYANTTAAIKKNTHTILFKTKNEILFYGTAVDPAYHLIVTIGNQPEYKSSKQLNVDTLVDHKLLHFITISDSTALATAKIDLTRIVKSIKTGEGYAHYDDGVMAVVNGAMNSNQFYKILSEIKQFPIPKNQGNSFELQMQLTYGSFLANNSDYSTLLAQQEIGYKLNDSIGSVIKNEVLGNEKAIDEIIQQAKTKRLVMINENHFYPSHRAVITMLLQRLKAEGYNYLALEALASDTVLNQAKAYPTLATGFYTREQHYGNLLRTTKELGFTFVSYEHNGANKEREIKQAENLFRKTFAKDSNAKVLVVAGIDHILKQEDGNGKKWMAQLFFEKYHIEPLTISQTHLNVYRKLSPYTYQLISRDKFKGIGNVANVDLFLLNSQKDDWSSWPNRFNYRNQLQEAVQVSLFYEKELKNDSAYQSAVPYFTCLVAAKQAFTLPLAKNDNTFMIVYNKLGQVMSKEKIRISAN